jgi:hypothetical protein
MASKNDHPKFERTRYFEGMVLSADDFRTEQEYHCNKRRMHNRCLHGSRVACGLEVDLRRNKVHIEPGMALDCQGNEIVVSEPVKISLPSRKRRFFLTVAHAEIPIRPVHILGLGHGPETEKFSRIQETFELGWTARDPLAGHHWHNGAWVPCGRPHPIAIAKFVFRRRKIRLSKSFEEKISQGRQAW